MGCSIFFSSFLSSISDVSGGTCLALGRWLTANSSNLRISNISGICDWNPVTSQIDLGQCYIIEFPGNEFAGCVEPVSRKPDPHS